MADHRYMSKESLRGSRPENPAEIVGFLSSFSLESLTGEGLSHTDKFTMHLVAILRCVWSWTQQLARLPNSWGLHGVKEFGRTVLLPSAL